MRRVVVLSLLLFAPACADRAKRSMLLYGNGDYAGAARSADEGLAQHPDDHDLWGMRIRAALALGDAAGVATSYAAYTARRGDDDKELLRDLAIATLGQALASPSARLKIAAIDAIEELEINALSDRVAERLGDDDDRVAASAAVAVLHGYQQAPGVAYDMMRSENAEARRIAVGGVAKKVGKIAIADLEKAGADPEPRVRAVALDWLGMLKDRDAVEQCTKRLHDRDPTVRAAAASALARIGLGNLEALAKVALKDSSLAVRLAGIELLVAAPREDKLVALADDPDPIVALQAAVAVQRTHPELGARAIVRAIAADSPETRAAAANLAIRAVGSQAARPILLPLAGDRDLGVRLAAARALAHAGDRETARRVFTDALHGDPQAAADLADLGDPAGTDELDRLIRDPARSPDQRAAAASAHRAAHHVTPGLVAALADSNGLVRVEAAAALGALAK